MTERTAVLLPDLIPDTDLVLDPEAVADVPGHAAAAEDTPDQDHEATAAAILAPDHEAMAEGDIQEMTGMIATAITEVGADRRCHTGAVIRATGSIQEQVAVWACLV